MLGEAKIIERAEFTRSNEHLDTIFNAELYYQGLFQPPAGSVVYRLDLTGTKDRD